MLRQRGFEAYGVDWSQYALDHAYPDARPFLQRASATRLPFPDKHFAVVTTFDVLEHLNEDHVRLALRESARVSERQLHQVNTGRLPEWVYEGDDSHCLKHSLRRWRSLARTLGLDHTYLCEPDRRLPFAKARRPPGVTVEGVPRYFVLSEVMRLLAEHEREERRRDGIVGDTRRYLDHGPPCRLPGP